MAGMGQDVGANYSEMDSTVATFNNNVAELEQVLAKIARQVEQVGATWAGRGYGSFSDIMVRWNKNVSDLNTTLNEISTKVHGASVSLSDADDMISRSFNGVNGFGPR